MHKNQLQELAQRSCFNLPSYTSVREGPDHAPRFKAAVKFNGETFESPGYCFTLRQAEHSAAEVALNALSFRGPSNSLAAKILDETGFYKNLLQEVSQRVRASLPVYTTFRTGLGHPPVFTCILELARVIFTGEPAKNKKQAEKNVAMTAWLSLKSLVRESESSLHKKSQKDEQEHVIVARALEIYLIKARLERKCFPLKFPVLNPAPNIPQQSPASTSKILPFICPKSSPRSRSGAPMNNCPMPSQSVKPIASASLLSLMGNLMVQPNKFPAAEAVPYIPVQCCSSHHRIAPPVTIRNSVPVFSAPPLPSSQTSTRSPVLNMAPPVHARNPTRREEMPKIHPPLKMEDQQFSRHSASQIEQLSPLSKNGSGRIEELPFFKPHLFSVEESLGPKLLPACLPLFSQVSEISARPPTFEVPLTQVRTPISVASSSPTSSNASAGETKISVQDVQQVIKDLRDEAIA